MHRPPDCLGKGSGYELTGKEAEKMSHAPSQLGTLDYDGHLDYMQGREQSLWTRKCQ